MCVGEFVDNEFSVSQCLEGYGGLLLPVPWEPMEWFKEEFCCDKIYWWADSAGEAMDRVDAWIAEEKNRPMLMRNEGLP